MRFFVLPNRCCSLKKESFSVIVFLLLVIRYSRVKISMEARLSFLKKKIISHLSNKFKNFPTNTLFSAVKMKNISQHAYSNKHVYFGHSSTYVQMLFVVECICIFCVCQFQLELNKYARL